MKARAGVRGWRSRLYQVRPSTVLMTEDSGEGGSHDQGVLRSGGRSFHSRSHSRETLRVYNHLSYSLRKGIRGYGNHSLFKKLEISLSVNLILKGEAR